VPLFKKAMGSPFDTPDEWAVLRGNYEGRPMLVRVNVALRALAGHPDYGTQIGVDVPLNSPRDDGFPTPEEDQQLGAIQDRLQQELEATKRAVLTAVITTSGMREFVFYAATREWIEEWAPRFDHAVDSHTVQVIAQSDPDWSVYWQFAQK
jgi:hypothetical protein